MTLTITFEGDTGAGKTRISGLLAVLLMGITSSQFSHEDDLETKIVLDDPARVATELNTFLEARRDLYGDRKNFSIDRNSVVVATSNYLSNAGNFHESRKVDVKDLLALARADKVSDLTTEHLAPFSRLIEQLTFRPERQAPTPVADRAEPSDDFDTVDGYSPLASVLRDAYLQSAKGKGKERHANGKPFLMQPIMSIGRMVGPGYPLGQAMKKAQEAGGMFARNNTPAAKAELLGVIVYTAAAIILMEEQESKL